MPADKSPRFPAVPPDRLAWTAADGKPLPYTRWPARESDVANQPSCVFICVHGLSGAASDFWALGKYFGEQRDAVVYAMELRGQGNDPDKRMQGDIRAASVWIEDLSTFTAQVKARHPGVPVFWYGESMGALIALHAMAEPANRSAGHPPADGLILASPVVALRQMPAPWKVAIVRSLMRLAPGMRVSLESLGDRSVREQNVTSATTHKEQMEKTPHYVETFTFRLFREVEKLIRTSNTAGAAIASPLLVFYTPHDVFTSKEQVERFVEGAGTVDKAKVFFPDSYHLILHDKDRDQLLDQLRSWANEHGVKIRTVR
ncbi:MAG: alpha/beta fold hydrolase [Verrucomicrobiae bacterium]|nr:alpha/beta fold hydrolase [Verrucomicrobiae bacterium]